MKKKWISQNPVNAAGNTHDVLYSILNAIQDGITVMDTNYIILLQNEITRRLHKGHEATGQPCYKIHYGRNEPCDNCHAVEAMKTGQLVRKSQPFQQEGPCGQIFDVYAYPVIDEHGSTTGVVEYLRDITELKKREETLEENEVKYRNMVENINEALYIHDFQGKILDVNQQACHMTGYERHELVGASLTTLLDKEAALKLPEKMERVKRLGKAVFESTDRHKNGEYIPVEASVKVISHAGDGLVQSIVRDISARRESEKQVKLSESRYQTITSVSGIGAWEYNHETNQDWYSPMYFRMLGYNEKDFFSHDQTGYVNVCHVLIHPEDKKMAQNNLDQYLEGGSQGTYESTFRMKRKDGTWAWIMSRGQTLKDENGNLMKLTVGTHVDITENRQILHNLEENNRQLIEAKGAAEAANATKSQFLANMSHELRTPLNGFMGMVQLLQSTSLDEEQNEYVNIALEASHSLVGVVGDILNYTSLEKEKMHINNVPFKLEKLLHEVIGLHQAGAIFKGISLTWRKDESTPDELTGDPFRLKQVLGNLIGNAVKFTKQGAVHLSVKKVGVQQNPGYINLSFKVIDTGIGISKELMDHIFQPFTQADESHTREFGGLGLGLAVVKEQASILGGVLSVDSTPGKGSVFTFTCEMKLSEIIGLPEEGTEADRISLKPSETNLLKVLVVEDDFGSRRMAQLILEKMGCDVDTAHNGVEALELTAQHQYQLVLMDCQMPVMDGYEATQQIREREKQTNHHVPVVAMTAKVLPGDREKCLNAGMDRFLSKPIEREKLEELVRDILWNT